MLAPKGLIAVGRRDRVQFAPLFAGHESLRVLVDACLAGETGHLWVDRRSRPSVALIDAAYCFLGGDARAPAAAAVLAAIPPGFLTFVPERAWTQTLAERWGGRLRHRRRWRLARRSLSRRRLRAQAARLPAGCSLHRIGAAEVRDIHRRIDLGVTENFRGTQDFLARGFGFCVKHEGRVVAAASSFAVVDDRAEIGVATDPAFRRQGLAVAVGARLLSHCLDRGRIPSWDASSPASRALALKLGFRAPIAYRAYYPEAG
jgi:RimJ/RimL family protein N-acetyltransferase